MGGGAEDFFVEASYMPFTPAARDEDLQTDQLCAVIACIMPQQRASERADICVNMMHNIMCALV